MIQMLAQAEPVFLLSLFKPIVTLVLLAGWAWVVSNIDKDLEYFYLPRYICNAILFTVAALAFLQLFLVPLFLIGVLVWLILIGGSIGGYAYYRNQKVPEHAKWSLSLASFQQRVSDMQQAQAHRRSAVQVYDPNGKPAEVPSQREPNYEAYSAFDNVLFQSLERHASRLEISVSAKEASVRAYVDGVQHPGPELESTQALALVDYVKQVCKLDTSDRRKRQTAKLRADSEETGSHSLSVTTYGSTRDLRLDVDFDLESRHNISLDKSGLLPQQRQQLNAVLDEKGKVIIVSAPHGSGVSTTLYGMLERHDPYTASVMAIETDSTLDLEGVNMQALDPNLSIQEMQQFIASRLRSDPDVVLLDHLKDQTTAQLIAKSSEDMRFFLQFERSDTMSALAQWIKLVGDRRLAASSLGAIVTQRLVRRLCKTCRVPFTPDPAALKKLGIPANKVDKLYRASGKVEIKGKPEICPDCKGLAYRGRIGVYEVMALDHQARTYIGAGELDRLKSHLRKNKMMYLQEAALARVVEGVTDIKEITRVLDRGSKSSSRSRKPSADKPAQPAQSSSNH